MTFIEKLGMGDTLRAAFAGLPTGLGASAHEARKSALGAFTGELSEAEASELATLQAAIQATRAKYHARRDNAANLVERTRRARADDIARELERDLGALFVQFRDQGSRAVSVQITAAIAKAQARCIEELGAELYHRPIVLICASSLYGRWPNLKGYLARTDQYGPMEAAGRVLAATRAEPVFMEAALRQLEGALGQSAIEAQHATAEGDHVLNADLIRALTSSDSFVVHQAWCKAAELERQGLGRAVNQAPQDLRSGSTGDQAIATR